MREKVNWMRGFLRIWAVLSVCWLAFSVLLNADVFLKNIRPIYQFETHGHSFVIRGAPDLATAEKAAKEFVSGEEQIASSKYAPLAELAFTPSALPVPMTMNRLEEDSGEYGPLLWMALMPPLVALSILYILRWIFSGFSRTERAKP